VSQDEAKLRYPIGPFRYDPENAVQDRAKFIEQLEQAPTNLRAAVAGLSEAQLDTPYRPGGWTVRQVVHHLPDSHLNAYVRFRLALTEDEPQVKTYEEDKWAELHDARTAPTELSLTLFGAVHARWVLLLRSLQPEDFTRNIRHPELGLLPLDRMLAIYAWHGRHHVAHILGLRQREGWDATALPAEGA
jgi:hypothetical protein